jgi:hypothetical protein
MGRQVFSVWPPGRSITEELKEKTVSGEQQVTQELSEGLICGRAVCFKKRSPSESQ